MSKYNLIDIYEQYQIGSGWTRNFDYEGMLNAGLKIDTDTPIEVMKKISDDFEDVNYHRENNYLQDAIDALEAGDVFGANGKLNDFRHEIKNTMAKYEMDMSDDLGAYMASKMDMMNEDEFDEARQSAIESSQEKAGIKEITSSESSRIEGLLSIPLKAKFLNAFEELYFDLVEEDPFADEDVVDHLANQMLIHLDDIQARGDSLAGLDQQEFTAIDEEETVTRDKMIDTAAKMIKDRILKDVPMDIIMDFVKTHLQDIRKMSNSEIKDEFEEFRSVNYDYIDENLKEHFGRFMKDCQ